MLPHWQSHNFSIWVHYPPILNISKDSKQFFSKGAGEYQVFSLKLFFGSALIGAIHRNKLELQFTVFIIL